MNVIWCVWVAKCSGYVIIVVREQNESCDLVPQTLWFPFNQGGLCRIFARWWNSHVGVGSNRYAMNVTRPFCMITCSWLFMDMQVSFFAVGELRTKWWYMIRYDMIYDIYDIYYMIWYIWYIIWYMIHDTIWYDIWYNICMIWYDILYMIHDTIWYDIYDIYYIIWYMIWYDIYYMIWYDTWYDMIWYIYMLYIIRGL